MTGEPKHFPPGLAARLLAAQLLVVLTGAVTSWIVAAAVGPALFLEHLRRAAGDAGSAVEHAQRAYASATGITTAVATTAALAAAIAVSLFAARRIVRSVAAVSAAAVDVASGRHDTRIALPRLGPELDTLAASFNTMADRLDGIERTRRRLLSDLAHELRTPTATIEGYLEAAHEGVVELDEATLAMLRTQTSRLARLAVDLAAVSQVDEHALHLGLADLSPVLAAAVDAHRLAAEAAQVALHADLPDSLPASGVDADRLGQVVTNLLDNAVRHTPPGGSVTVTARTTAGRVEVTVGDTGEGIAAEHLDRVFERFYRAGSRDDHRGSGIGLAIARAIVQAHGGAITAASAGPGKGATFTFWVPTATVATDRSA